MNTRVGDIVRECVNGHQLKWDPFINDYLLEVVELLKCGVRVSRLADGKTFKISSWITIRPTPAERIAREKRGDA